MSFTLCLNTSTIKPTPIMDKIRLTAEAGFPAIELWVDEIYQYIGQGGEVSDIEKSLADHGLSVPCMIASRGWAEASEFERPPQMEDFKRRLELATRMGSPWLVCSPARFPCDIGQITRRYKELLEIGRNIGAKPTFEYISFFESVASLPQAWQVVQDVDDPDATLIADAFHSWNTNSTLDDLRAVPVERISHYHIDDAHPDIPPLKQLDPDRVMIGDGVIDLKAELTVLKEKGYTGAISLELFNPDLWAQDPRDVLKLGFERLTALVESV